MDKSVLELALHYRMEIYELKQDRSNVKNKTTDRLIWAEIKNLQNDLLDTEIKLFFSEEDNLDTRVLNAVRRFFTSGMMTERRISSKQCMKRTRNRLEDCGTSEKKPRNG